MGLAPMEGQLAIYAHQNGSYFLTLIIFTPPMASVRLLAVFFATDATTTNDATFHSLIPYFVPVERAVFIGPDYSRTVCVHASEPPDTD